MGRKKGHIGEWMENSKRMGVMSDSHSRMSEYNWMYQVWGLGVMKNTWLASEWKSSCGTKGKLRYAGALVAVGKRASILGIYTDDEQQSAIFRDAVLSIVKPEMTVREMAAEIGSLDWVR